MRIWSLVSLFGALMVWSEPLTAQSASTEIEPFSEFVDSLTVAPADAYVGQSGVAVESSSAFEAMRRHLVKMYSGVTVAHSLQVGNQVVDCARSTINQVCAYES